MSIPSGLPTRHLTPQPVPVLSPRPIGTGLESVRRELELCGKELRSAMPPRGVMFVDKALDILSRLTCRIAVIGQVKSGKSSFINALVQRRDLLPTGVNPWTTAITQLHFDRAESPPNVAAEFKFFDANEWEHLAKGNGYIRELTQRLVPGFEEDLLRSHVDAMRRRSEERLGAKLNQLLGTKHAYSEVTAEVLERYVCSGPLDDVRRNEIYSDIVKSADLYFSGGNEFGFPTTIVDTPGTNDPFLVRDEITRRALATADIYVVVLTARQALSSADIALIRILRGLNKDRFAIFINRIDELGDIVRDVQTIVQHVKVSLKREFPGSAIPVIAGSAFWANAAQFGSLEDIDRAYSSNAEVYARHLNIDGGAGHSGDAGDRAQNRRARVLAQCSGLQQLSQELAKLAIHSHTGLVLKQISRSFLEFVDVGQSAVHHEVQLIEHEAARDALSANGQAGGAYSVDNQQVAVLLQGVLEDLQVRSSQAIEKHFKKLREQLFDVIQAFADNECGHLRQAIAAGHRHVSWRCDTVVLRRELEQAFVGGYHAAQRELNGIGAQLIPALRALLRRHYPRWKSSELEQGGMTDMPPLHALSQTVSLDLGEPWWRRWWSMVRREEDRIADIERLIKTEFNPVAEEMVMAAREHLQSLQDIAKQRASAVYLGLVEAMEEQFRAQEASKSARAAFSAFDGSNPRVIELRTQLARLQLVSQRLNSLDRKWASQVS